MITLFELFVTAFFFSSNNLTGFNLTVDGRMSVLVTFGLAGARKDGSRARDHLPRRTFLDSALSIALYKPITLTAQCEHCEQEQELNDQGHDRKEISHRKEKKVRHDGSGGYK